MSPSMVFAHNLRKLCEQSTSIAQVARDLDISKVQMNRFLKGSSLPKPAVLQRVCDYFGLDARILLEPINDEELILLAPTTRAPDVGKRFANTLTIAQRSGFEYILSPSAYQGDADYLPSGLYLWWRRSLSRKDTILQIPIRVSIHRGAHVVRGYDPRDYNLGGLRPSNAARDREFRGLVVRHVVGMSMLIHARDRNDSILFSYYSRTGHLGPDLYSGYATLTRPYAPGLGRVAPSLIKRLTGAEANPVRLARLPSFVAPEALPDLVAAELSKTVEV